MNFPGKELELYNQAIKSIKETNEKLINELDELIKDYKKFNQFEIKFYLNEEMNEFKKIEYLKELREKLLKMNDCDKVKVKVASPLHPMCWCYHLSKLFPKNEKIKNYIMYRILCSILY